MVFVRGINTGPVVSVGRRRGQHLSVRSTDLCLTNTEAHVRAPRDCIVFVTSVIRYESDTYDTMKLQIT